MNLWSDSTTVLEWLQSDSCRHKVFIGTCVSEIQEVTNRQAWRYVDTQNNPTNDIMRGKPLLTLAEPSRWSHGPAFLKQSSDQWPKKPEQATAVTSSELKGIIFCSFAAFNTWKELVGTTRQANQGVHWAAADPVSNQPISHRDAESLLLTACQSHSFPEEVTSLKAQRSVSNQSRLVSLAPEWDS